MNELTELLNANASEDELLITCFDLIDSGSAVNDIIQTIIDYKSNTISIEYRSTLTSIMFDIMDYKKESVYEQYIHSVYVHCLNGTGGYERVKTVGDTKEERMAERRKMLGI